MEVATLQDSSGNADGNLQIWCREFALRMGRLMPYRKLVRLRKATSIRNSREIICIAKAITAEVTSYLAKPDTLGNLQSLELRSSEAATSHTSFHIRPKLYADSEQALLERLNAVIDTAGGAVGRQELIDVADDQDALSASLIERHARTTLQQELTTALNRIDKGNERVQDEKFADLSKDIRRWWNLLRPDEPTFSSTVRPRKNCGGGGGF